MKRKIISGGDGTENNPYQISSIADLQALAAKVNIGESYAGTYFQLTRDIDLGGADNPWTGSIRSFAGVFEGDNHRIDGLYIGENNYDYGAGLFSGNSGTIQNLTVAGEVAGGGHGGISERSGSFVSRNTGTVINCRSELNITAASNHGRTVGGVVGQNHGRVENCSYSGTLSGGSDSSYVGGIVGNNSGGTVLNCYNAETVTGSSAVGNIAGRNYNGVIENCYYEPGDGQFTGVGDGVFEIIEGQSASGEIAWALQNPDKVNPGYAPRTAWPEDRSSALTRPRF